MALHRRSPARAAVGGLVAAGAFALPLALAAPAGAAPAGPGVTPTTTYCRAAQTMLKEAVALGRNPYNLKGYPALEQNLSVMAHHAPSSAARKHASNMRTYVLQLYPILVKEKAGRQTAADERLAATVGAKFTAASNNTGRDIGAYCG